MNNLPWSLLMKTREYLQIKPSQELTWISNYNSGVLGATKNLWIEQPIYSWVTLPMMQFSVRNSIPGIYHDVKNRVCTLHPSDFVIESFKKYITHLLSLALSLMLHTCNNTDGNQLSVIALYYGDTYMSNSPKCMGVNGEGSLVGVVYIVVLHEDPYVNTSRVICIRTCKFAYKCQEFVW